MRATDDDDLKPSMSGRKPANGSKPPQTNMQKMIERMHGKPPRVGSTMFVPLPPPSHRQAIVCTSRHTTDLVNHVRYLQELGKGLDGERPIGFSHDQEDVKLTHVVADWKTDEIHYRRVLPSPAEDIDMKEYTRIYVSKLEKDFKMPPGSLQYAAVIHHDTEHIHTQMVIRGRDHLGRKLDICENYAHNIEWRRASDAATEIAGPRPSHEIALSAFREIEKRELGIEHPELSLGGGWKLNINVDRSRKNENTRGIMDYLRENRIKYTMNFTRTHTEVLVASVGSFDRAQSISREIQNRFGEGLRPIQNRYLEQSGLMLNESMSTRFEPKGDRDFSKLTAKGIPLLKEHERQLRGLDIAEKMEIAQQFREPADRELMNRYGAFYGGKERDRALEQVLTLKREEHELGL
jgi:hypothetical protein